MEYEGLPVKILDLDDEVGGPEMTDTQREKVISEIESLSLIHIFREIPMMTRRLPGVLRIRRYFL